MNNYVNKINKNSTDYDIQDARIPSELGTAGQLLKLTENGVVWGYDNVGTVLYNHIVQLHDTSTDIIPLEFRFISQYNSDSTDVGVIYSLLKSSLSKLVYDLVNNIDGNDLLYLEPIVDAQLQAVVGLNYSYWQFTNSTLTAATNQLYLQPTFEILRTVTEI